MDNQVTLFEYIWRNCYQIVCWEKENSEELFPDVFGCGFLIQRDDKYIFITADHVVHKKDYDEGIRTGQEYKCALVNNLNMQTELGFETVLSDLPDFSYCDKHNLQGYFEGREDLDVAMIPEMIDIAYCKIKPPFKKPLLTGELHCGDEVLCRAGLEKLCIANEAFAEVDASAEYFVFGTLCNKLSGIRWDRVNALHCRIRFLDRQNEMLRFTYPDGIREDEWEGLSGSPVFSSQGSLVGMVVRAVEGNNTLWVYPIHYILQIINFIENLP